MEALARWFPALPRYVPPDIFQRTSKPQAAFLVDDSRESFYGGAAGGGKSAALLMGALQYADIPGYRALILRRTFAQLAKGDALIPLSHEWLADTDAKWNEQKKVWTFPSGATLEFGHVENEASKYDYQGAAYQYVGFDELTQFTQSQYEYIAFSRQRRKTGMADLGVPIRVRSTANPGGVGHIWVRKRFIDPPKPANGIFIPARVRDNPGLDADDYERSLMHLSPELRRQLMDGDWGAIEGAAFEQFSPALHVVERFPLPAFWDRYECCDYGLNGTAWFCVGVDPDGNQVFHDSIYVDNLIPSQVAPLVLARRMAGWGMQNRAWMDPSVWHRTGTLNRWGAPATLATEFEDNGVVLSKANNDPRAGYMRLRELLRPDPLHRFPDWHPRHGERGSPRLFIVGDTCPRLVEQIAAALLQPLERADGGEKVDPEWEGSFGHAVAAARYGVMSRPGPSANPDPGPPDDPRIAALLKYERRIESGEHRAGRYINV